MRRRYRRRPGGWLWAALVLVPLLLVGVAHTSGTSGPGGDTSEAGTATAAPPEPTSPFTLMRSGDAVVVTAEVPSRAAKATLLDAVRARVRDGVTVVDKVHVVDGAVAPDPHALARLAVAAGPRGDYAYDFDGDALVLMGTAASEKARQGVAAAAESAVPAGDVYNQIQVLAQPTGCDNLQTDITRILTRHPVTFATGSSSVDATTRSVLGRVVDRVGQCPDAFLEVDGYTDSVGTRATNSRLSAARAEHVADALVDAGLDPSHLRSRGHGAGNPVASNATAEGRAANRRVEINVR